MLSVTGMTDTAGRGFRLGQVRKRPAWPVAPTARTCPSSRINGVSWKSAGRFRSTSAVASLKTSSTVRPDGRKSAVSTLSESAAAMAVPSPKRVVSPAS